MHGLRRNTNDLAAKQPSARLHMGSGIRYAHLRFLSGLAFGCGYQLFVGVLCGALGMTLACSVIQLE